jgi:Ca-activated chloride channel family protein
MATNPSPSSSSSRRRNTLIAVAVLVIILLLLLLTRCKRERPAAVTPPAPVAAPSSPTPAPAPSTPVTETPPATEVLGAATVQAPAQVAAGSVFAAAWTGPNNKGDFLTIVPEAAAPTAYASYRETQHGPSLELTAPIEAGKYEVRYVTGLSKTVLARALMEVLPAGATLDGPAEVVIGTQFQVAWAGPNNKDDFLTIVPPGAPDAEYASYAETAKGTPASLTAPVTAGDAELRYVTGQGKKVLARRAIKVIEASVSITAPGRAIAGTTIDVTWTGPNNKADYITIVAAGTPDGQYAHYTDTAKGSPLKLLMPIMNGPAELRYMTGQGRRVLARRAIEVVAAEVTLAAPPQAKAGADVSITWTGPNNTGDYITLVTKGTPDGQYAAYTETKKGSPLTVKAPAKAGDAEVRYMTGQGNKVLARVAIVIE